MAAVQPEPWLRALITTTNNNNNNKRVPLNLRVCASFPLMCVRKRRIPNRFIYILGLLGEQKSDKSHVCVCVCLFVCVYVWKKRFR
jgi:hypothetical protein